MPQVLAKCACTTRRVSSGRQRPTRRVHSCTARWVAFPRFPSGGSLPGPAKGSAGSPHRKAPPRRPGRALDGRAGRRKRELRADYAASSSDSCTSSRLSCGRGIHGFLWNARDRQIVVLRSEWTYPPPYGRVEECSTEHFQKSYRLRSVQRIVGRYDEFSERAL